MTTASSSLSPGAEVSASTLVELLRQRAALPPDCGGYTFLLDGESQEARLSFVELDKQARAIAATLQRLDARGQRALLLYAPGLPYIAGFLGCLYAGVIAVPLYPPDLSRPARTLPRVAAITADATATFALTTASLLPLAQVACAALPQLQPLRWVATDAIDSGESVAWQDPGIDAETVAFLQYTSGTTGVPKGVVLTHANLLHNLSWIQRCFGTTSQSPGVIWLPPYHDMGLIGGILQPLYLGSAVTLLSPVDFLRKPLRWLQAISRRGCTVSGGPNFAYDLCVRKTTPEQRAGLDLSRWEVAFNGAEPVLPETLHRFAEAFAPCGFRPEAFYPCYGLAEATLIATGGQARTPVAQRTVDAAALQQRRAVAVIPAARGARSFVSCGRSLSDQRLLIAHPDSGALCAEGEIGEIWLSGPSVATGYWQRPQETACTFQARLSGKDDSTPFLRTGDLGFLDTDGGLLVTGRLKDLIIIRGRNHYPQDLEQTVVQCHPALRRGCGAAFAVETGGAEQVVVVQELDQRGVSSIELGTVTQAIRQAVAEEHALQLYAVVLVAAGTIAKTSSGKLQRHACRADFVAGSLEVVFEDRLATPPAADEPADFVQPGSLRQVLAATDQAPARLQVLVDHLRAHAGRVLGLSPTQVDPERSLYAFGLDSLTAVELQSAMESALGRELPLTGFLQDASLAKVAEWILLRPESPGGAPAKEPGRATELADLDAPMSSGQKSLWFLHQLAPQSSAYHVPVALRVRAPLDVPALQRTFATLLARHPALRTTFAMAAAGPVQRVHAALPLDFEAVDAATWSDAKLAESLSVEARQPFDLQCGPLLRVRLYTRATVDHVLLFTLPHINIDLWSLAILAQEFDVLYPALGAGQPALLPPPRWSYPDYSRWQADMLAGPRGAQLESWWLAQLGGELPVLDLPLSRLRPPIQTYAGCVHTARLDAGLTKSLKDLAGAQAATLNMVLQAGFQALLHRYSGQEDLVIGIVGTGRPRTEHAQLVGYCANPIAIRTRPTPEQRFTALLAETKRMVIDALAHQDYPFNLLVERLEPVRDPSRSPLFQVMFVFQRAPLQKARGLTQLALDLSGAHAELGGLSIESMALPRQAAQLDLTLTMGESDGELIASFEYNTDLFDPEPIARLAENFKTLLAGIVKDPTAHLADLPLLSADEREWLLGAGRGEVLPLSPGQDIPARFAAQALRTPDATAVIFARDRLTYRELAARAQQLAGVLAARGVGAGARVGLFLPRSLEMVVAVLGVLRAGAAYVPLDPALPSERLAFLVDDAQTALLVTHSQLSPRGSALPTRLGAALELLCLDTDLSGEDNAAPCAQTIKERQLACLIYTSGSTGQPKGVMLEHGSLGNLVESFLRSYDADARDRILPLTSLASASFVGEIFPLLCTGGTLVLPTEEEVLDLDRLVGLISSHGVTIASTVPAMVAALNARGGSLGPLRLLLSGGEALAESDVARLLDQVVVVNSYGLTETTVCATHQKLSAGDLRSSVWLPIGRPILNTTIYVLDAQRQLLPRGCTGELYVGGAALAGGYFQRPELTAERFVPDPYRPGEQMYRTGDRGRWLRDGTLGYLHRLDDQVKIRGFRIELAEITIALRRHPAVREAFVMAREDAPGDKRLVAYVIAAAATPTSGELHAWLAERLPGYMIPAAFVPLEALPLTRNGKVDHQALPAPDRGRLAPAATYTPPRSEIERRIAGIWKQLLQLDEVGIHDNFFALGGNSMLLAELHRRLREELGAALALTELFQHSTISALAQRTSGDGLPKSSYQRIQNEAERRQLALAHRQQSRARSRQTKDD